jgi:hypothetical protein
MMLCCTSCPGGGSGTATALLIRLLASGVGFRKTEGSISVEFKVRAPGLRIEKPGRLKPFLSCEVPSHLWLGPAAGFAFTLANFVPFPWDENCVLGIAKLLPHVGPVKRETQQVVSLAMTGLVPGCGHVFHNEENRDR